jgi:two-component system chemotaxis response regulator CheV
MSNPLLKTVDSRTNLAGKNRFEMLKFVVGGQNYGINVFKVREVIRVTGEISAIPGGHEHVLGATSLRGASLIVVDMAHFLKGESTCTAEEGVLLVTEYNRTMQAFLVDEVIGITNLSWEDITPPPSGAASKYLTGVCRIDDELVMLPDVEQILSEISPVQAEASDNVAASVVTPKDSADTILIVDDSAVARKQVARALSKLPFKVELANNGREGLEKAVDLAKKHRLALIISDIEMPEMDGYTLTAECRGNPVLKDARIVLHSSLSGVFNEALVKKVGANEFIPKFSPDDLIKTIVPLLNC